ncbi:MAG TPA: hypothetical protein VGT44_15545 [Ktedonobacteraceae bacterium]|nr:hypothetical protein [Ktedonobacteraceae bacterium]
MAELSDSDTEFILQVARAVVEEVAPEELVLFPLMAEAFVHSPESLLISKGPGGVELGMGAGELIVTWTPTILLLLQQAVLQGARDAVTEGTKELVTGVFGRVRGLWQAKGRKQAATLPARGQDLSREELQLLRTFLYEAALQHGVKDARAQQIADCAVVKWVTRPVSEVRQR